jgi:chromate reductase
LSRKPSAIIGASTGKLGTAIAQQNLRSVLSFCNAPQMSAPEAYIQFTPGLVTDDGEDTNASTEDFLRNFMFECEQFIARELTVVSPPP